MNDYTIPDFTKAAIITIDTQNDFSLPGAIAEIAGTEQILPAMQRILDAARIRGMPIIHVVRIYREDGSNVDLCRRSAIEDGAQIVAPDSLGVQLVESIMPNKEIELDCENLLRGELQAIGEREWAMYKPRWGAFYLTRLEEFLRQQGVNTLVFIGCNYPNCPRTSMYEASERDFKVVMVEDAISGVYERGVSEMSKIGIQIYQADEVIDKMDKDG